MQFSSSSPEPHDMIPLQTAEDGRQTDPEQLNWYSSHSNESKRRITSYSIFTGSINTIITLLGLESDYIKAILKQEPE